MLASYNNRCGKVTIICATCIALIYVKKRFNM